MRLLDIRTGHIAAGGDRERPEHRNEKR